MISISITTPPVPVPELQQNYEIPVATTIQDNEVAQRLPRAEVNKLEDDLVIANAKVIYSCFNSY